MGRCQEVFDWLKQAVTKEPVLILLDGSKLYEIETDVSDYAISGVLMDGHPVTFKSRKPKETERQYTI